MQLRILQQNPTKKHRKQLRSQKSLTCCPLHRQQPQHKVSHFYNHNHHHVSCLIFEDLNLTNSILHLTSLTQLHSLSLKCNRFDGPIPSLWLLSVGPNFSWILSKQLTPPLISCHVLFLLKPWCCYIGPQPQSLQISFKSKP